MSPADVNVTAEKDDIVIVVQHPPVIPITAITAPVVAVVAAGNVGPPGPQGKWVAMTQAEYNAIPVKDPDTLYVIVV